jgi:hypothetical protein
MIKLKALLNNQWFFPFIMLYYGMFYILFGETYPFHGGYSTDGYVFASFIPDFTKSFFFNSYYVHRILPSLILSVFFKLLSINPTEPHIFTAFQILNLIGIILSCYFLKQILILFKISFKNQLLAFALFLINFGVIKYPFYLPVMTDTFALMLSTALLYFYLKNNLKGLVICTLLSAFTWPMTYYQGLLLLAFPYSVLPITNPLKWQKIVIYSSSVLYILILLLIYIFIEKIEVTVDHVMRIDRNILPLSIFGIVLFYFFCAKIFLNKKLFDLSFFLKKLNYKRLLISFCVFVAVSLIIFLLNPDATPSYSTARTLREPILYALIKPLFYIVADTSYFGIIVCLLLLFWNSFCKTLSQMGWGLVMAFALNLFLFGTVPESRRLINLLPWLTIFLIKSLNKFSFSNNFYIVVGILSFIASKIWLILNIYNINSTINLDKNGSIGFPGQILWMNIGPWMSEQMYYIQGGVMLFFIGILFLMLYKVEVNEFNKLKLVRKFQILK